MDGLEGYIAALRERCAGLPDRRTGSNGRYTMIDIGLAAFSVFFMQSPSFLAHQTALADGPGRGLSNAHTLFGMTAIPCDNHPALFDPQAGRWQDGVLPHLRRCHLGGSRP